MGGCASGATGKNAVMMQAAAALLDRLPPVRGTLTADADIASLIWFRCGGRADILFEPADADDLVQFLQACPADVPVHPLGLGSNMIVRDGGVDGVVVRLGKAFSWVETVSGDLLALENILNCGGGTPGILVASMARDHAIAGLEFLRGIPGTVGGAVRMNAGAYGRETADTLIDADVVFRSGLRATLEASAFGFSYRHSSLPEGAIVISARFQGHFGDAVAIAAEMDRIARERESSQPLRSRTGGSTFKNPPGEKAWQLVDAAGCRGLRIGGAQVSEKHTNFLINTGNATSADIEALGEEVRRRVLAQSGIALEWEIERIGRETVQ
jgi:UDP-N-acetylmuramate dehydrogenase